MIKDEVFGNSSSILLVSIDSSIFDDSSRIVDIGFS